MNVDWGANALRWTGTEFRRCISSSRMLAPKRMDYTGTALPQRAYRFRSREGSEGQPCNCLQPGSSANRPRAPDARWTAQPMAPDTAGRMKQAAATRARHAMVGLEESPYSSLFSCLLTP